MANITYSPLIVHFYISILYCISNNRSPGNYAAHFITAVYLIRPVVGTGRKSAQWLLSKYSTVTFT